MQLIGLCKKIFLKHKYLSAISSHIYNLIYFRRKSIRGRNNKVIYKNAFLNKCTVSVQGNNNIIFIGEKCLLKNCTLFIHGNNNEISLKDMVNANNAEFYIEDDGNKITIGKKTVLSGKIHLACIESTNIEVGEECLFSSDIVFRTGDSHSILDLNGKRINPSKDIIINDHVWIGHRVLVNKGAYVGANSIVATGALLTNRYEESNIILGGVPANVIKREVMWDKRRLKI